jgi:hypothetical protein
MLTLKDVLPVPESATPLISEDDWRVGDALPMRSHFFSRIDREDESTHRYENIVEVTATDEELEWIRSRFHNIPDRRLFSQMRWTGETAQFIYDHLTDKL